MYPRTNYEMTEQDLEKLLEAFKPTPVMFISGGQSIGGSQQENANDAWRRLGEKMGFDYLTVRPIQGKGNRFFSAVPSETVGQRKEREEKEAEEKRQADIAILETEISEKQKLLDELKKQGTSDDLSHS